MDSALNFTSNPKLENENTKKEGLRITWRDLEILEFVLEMKFSTLNDIHAKFFKHIQSGEVSKSTWWARERVAKLLKAGYLRCDKEISITPHFVLTMVGFYFLSNSLPHKRFCIPLATIDKRTHRHDTAVQKIRLKLEESGRATHWQSERALNEIQEIKKFLPKEFRPDGIYKDLHGEKVAFEFESAPKALSRYDDKINRYLNIMQCPPSPGKIFDKVHYVCERPEVAKNLINKTKLYQHLFLIEQQPQFLRKTEV